MKLRLWSTPVLLCSSMLLLGAHAGSAQKAQPREPKWLKQMYQEGWHKVREGVLRRATGGGAFETFSYGSEGLRWVVQDYERRVSLLENKYNQSPTKRLAEVIDQLKGEIARVGKALEVAPSTRRLDDKTLGSCSPSFGGTSHAGPQSGTSGVEASAEAYFYSDCGQLGDTFAMAYAHAIAGTVETTVTQNDLKNSGSWLHSHAGASANGSTGCESEAQGSVTSSELSIHYQTPYAQNFSCPPQSSKLTLDPNQITLDGPQSDGNPGLLADEQAAAGDPRMGDNNDLTSNWYTTLAPHANAAIIDLGGVYRIDRIYLYDRNGAGGGTDGNFTVTAGSTASGWTNTLISDPLESYLVWKGFPNNPANDLGSFVDDPTLEFSGVTTRYLRVVNPTGYLVMPEIVVYGAPVP